MQNAEFVKIGKVRDSHGLRGELYIIVFSGQMDWLADLKSFKLTYLQLAVDGKHAPGEKIFTIKKIRAHKKGFIVKTNEMKDRNESDVFRGSECWIANDLVKSKPGEYVYLNDIVGFDVRTEKDGVLGKIHVFSTNGAQDLLVLEGDKGQLEIPFVKEFTRKIDWKNKSILLEIPEGLVNL